MCKAVGKSKSTFTDVRGGKVGFSANTLKLFAEYLNVSVDYLMNGKEADPFTTIDNILPIKTKKVPLLGDIACGEPIYAEEQHGEYVLATEGINADFCLRAKGDSMIGARIFDGDIVFCEKTETVDNGQIAAVIIEDEATLKRVYYYPESGKLVLNPENPAYEPLVYLGEELNRVRILGRAVAFQSYIR
jgi:repressor LexA